MSHQSYNRKAYPRAGRLKEVFAKIVCVSAQAQFPLEELSAGCYRLIASGSSPLSFREQVEGEG